MVTMPRVKDLKKESFWWAPLCRTRAGTVLYSGTNQVLDTVEGTRQQNLSMRDYLLLYARREKGQPEGAMRIIEWPPDTFMGEQFLEGGFQLPSGRLIFTMCGVAVRGEVSVRLVDGTGTALPGFDWGDGIPVRGDSLTVWPAAYWEGRWRGY